jgi:hypothetical protein
MTQDANLHPRKLYTTLCSRTELGARASTALDFLRSNTGAESGFLLLPRGGELYVAARSMTGALPSSLMERALTLWASESEVAPNADPTRTVEMGQLGPISAVEIRSWLPDGQCFEPCLLATYRDSEWVPVGIAVLKVRPGEAIQAVRRAHIDAVCNAFIDCAKTSGV